jgi:alanine-glyoxylate transaminase/serine-glyoxylate transaminase/serine-pyruvate transaminase
MGLQLLPPAAERLWSLNAVRVPPGIDEAAIRRALLTEFSIEIGGGLGQLAGKIWRVGLMGSSSTRPLVLLFLGALEHVLRGTGYKCDPGAGVGAASEALASESEMEGAGQAS